MADVNKTLDENGWIKYTVTTDKTLVDYIVSKKEDGFSSYLISLTKGNTPKSLSGVYTTPDKALKALLSYISSMKVSPTVQRDTKYKERDEYRKAQKKDGSTAVHTDDKGKVQQGASD